MDHSQNNKPKVDQVWKGSHFACGIQINRYASNLDDTQWSAHQKEHNTQELSLTCHFAGALFLFVLFFPSLIFFLLLHKEYTKIGLVCIVITLNSVDTKHQQLQNKLHFFFVLLSSAIIIIVVVVAVVGSLKTELIGHRIWNANERRTCYFHFVCKSV